MKQAGSAALVVALLTGCSADLADEHVRHCAADLLSQVAQKRRCDEFLKLGEVRRLDTASRGKGVMESTAELELEVTQRLHGQSRIAKQCTGTDFKGREALLLAGDRLRLKKVFRFERYESGWRCTTAEMAPILSGERIDRAAAKR